VTQNEDELTAEQQLRELLCEGRGRDEQRFRNLLRGMSGFQLWNWAHGEAATNTDWAWPRAAELDQALADFSQAVKKQAL
jgi:hypothetical protein